MLTQRAKHAKCAGRIKPKNYMLKGGLSVSFNPNDFEAPQPLCDFLFYLLTIRGKSERTVEGYYIDLRFFLRYLKASHMRLPMEGALEDIAIADVSNELICSVTISDAYAFLNYVQTVQNNNAKTRARKVSSLRAFYKYLTIKTPLLSSDPMESLEIPAQKKSMPKYLTLEESKTLLEVIDGPYKLRDYCMITLMLNCGMRVSELVGIKLENIRENTLTLLGKGNKERLIYLNEACLDALQSYLQVRKTPTKSEYKSVLFVTKNSEPLTTRRVEQIVEKNLALAGLSGRGFSPHKLRHTAATLMYQYGNVDIRVLKEILGHANLGTTQIYTHVADRQMEQAAAASPLANIRAPKPTKSLNLQEEQKTKEKT